MVIKIKYQRCDDIICFLYFCVMIPYTELNVIEVDDSLDILRKGTAKQIAMVGRGLKLN